jgi:hypothetical protein
VATRLRHLVENPATWKRGYRQLQSIPSHRELAERAVEKRRGVSDDVRREAERIVAEQLAANRRMLERTRSPRFLARTAVFASTLQLTGMALLGVLWACVARGGLGLRLIDAAVVGADGEEVSRSRATVRALVAWSPVFVADGILFLSRGPARAVSPDEEMIGGVVVLGIFAAGGVYAALHPERGLQDQIAWTWLVPWS